MKYQLLLILFFSLIKVIAQEKDAYKIFDEEGKIVQYSKMMHDLSASEIILVGEIHNNALVHWIELQIARDLFNSDSQLSLGMEMFESDNQLILDEYLEGTIEEKHLLTEAKIWENYKTDYKPLVDFFKDNHKRVVATNIPRRYANLVFRKGIKALDNINKDAKQWIVPLPFEINLTLQGYKNMIGDAGMHNGIDNNNLATAQAIKDATMAHFILANLKSKFLHINGSYHSQNFEGIYWYLKKGNPKVRIATVHFAEQDQITKLEDANKGIANYIICIPADMTKTY